MLTCAGWFGKDYSKPTGAIALPRLFTVVSIVFDYRTIEDICLGLCLPPTEFGL
jgi:hypothetical protein